MPASQRYKRLDRRWQRYEKQLPGHQVQIDVKFIAPIAGASRRKHYQFTAIDDCTRLRVLRIYSRLNQRTAIQFADGPPTTSPGRSTRPWPPCSSGASYWSAVGLEVGAARAAPWSGARIAIPAVFVFTTVTLAVTLGHLDTFHVDADLPLTTRAVTWAWLAVYLVVPVLMVAATVAQRGESTAVPAPSGLPLAVRAVLVALAGLLLGLGLALLVAPGWADGVWPWPLTPLTGRAVGAWLVGLGTAAAHARLLDDRASLRPLGITGVVFGVLQAIALVRHGDELDWGSAPAAAYLAVLAALAVISAWSLLPSPPQRR